MSTGRRRRPQPPETSPFFVGSRPRVMLHAERLEHLLVGVILELLARPPALSIAVARIGLTSIYWNTLPGSSNGVVVGRELQPVGRFVIDRIVRRR